MSTHAAQPSGNSETIPSNDRPSEAANNGHDAFDSGDVRPTEDKIFSSTPLGAHADSQALTLKPIECTDEREHVHGGSTAETLLPSLSASTLPSASAHVPNVSSETTAIKADEDDMTVEPGSPSRPKLTREALTEKKGWDKPSLGADQFGMYMREKQRKLREQYRLETSATNKTSAHNNIFQGVTVWVNGSTSVSRLDVRRLVMRHGGRFETYPTKHVTHVVADNLALATRKRFLARRSTAANSTPLKFVTAQWVAQSVQQNARLSEMSFAIPGMRDERQKSVADMFAKKPANMKNKSGSKGVVKK